MKVYFSKFLAIYMLLGSFFPNLDFSQMKHIPDAYRHFSHHKAEVLEEGVQFSLWDFLDEHYINPNEHSHDDDGETHDHLPMQHMHNGLSVAFQQGEVPLDHVATQWLPVLIKYNERAQGFDYQVGIDRPPISA